MRQGSLRYSAVVRAMVVAELEAGGHALADDAEVLSHALAHRLQGLEAVGALVGMNAAALAVAVIDGDEDMGHALRHGDGVAKPSPCSGR